MPKRLPKTSSEKFSGFIDPDEIDLETGNTLAEDRIIQPIKRSTRKIRSLEGQVGSLRSQLTIQFWVGIIIGAVVSFAISVIWFN